ncbi:MAG: LptF/LptG family permease [Planctomycetota bacterium]|nr:LptF/LptG family permease [Planctomycetota bacterium]MDP6837854.1 LptF/LptG family permease [Planctomycetota bacterium]MDP6956454.1 LptF/LptG family permease [Planctomycetota bacterium]
MRLPSYILRQLLISMLFSVGGLAFVALPGTAVAALEKLPSVSTLSLVTYMAMGLEELLPYLAPLGFLLAVVSTYGRLATDNEWTAMRMAGLHPLRTIMPALVVAMLLSLITHGITATDLPQVKDRQRVFRVQAVRDDIVQIAPGRTDLKIGGLYLVARDRAGDRFLDAYLHVPGEGGSREMLADEVTFDFTGKNMLVQLTNARLVRPEEGEILYSESPTVEVNLESLLDSDSGRPDNPRYWTSAEIRRALAGGELPVEREREYRYQISQRQALSVTYFLFLFLGVPIGLKRRRSSALGGTASALGVALCYFVLSMRLGKPLGTTGIMPPELAAWLTTVLGALLGLVYLRRTWRS